MADDLTANDFELLEYIYSNPGTNLLDLLDQFPVGYEERIKKLLSLGLIEDKRLLTSSADKSRYLGLYCITAAGMAGLQDYASHKVKERREIIHDWRVAIFSTIGGAIAGLIASIIFWLLTNSQPK